MKLIGVVTTSLGELSYHVAPGSEGLPEGLGGLRLADARRHPHHCDVGLGRTEVRRLRWALRSIVDEKRFERLDI